MVSLSLGRREMPGAVDHQERRILGEALHPGIEYRNIHDLQVTDVRNGGKRQTEMSFFPYNNGLIYAVLL